MRCPGQYVCQLKPMQQSRHVAQPTCRIAGEKHGSVERLAGSEPVRKVKRVVTTGHAHATPEIRLYGDAPRAAPGQCAKPHGTGIFSGAGRRQCKPRVVLLCCRATATLENGLA